MRLIDADELMEKFKEWIPKCGSELLESDRDPLENLAVSALMEIEEAPTIEVDSKWISCSERLPEKECLCLVTIKKKNGGYKVDTELYCYDNHGIGGFWTFDYIVAWMPLPDPYKG